VTHQEVDSDISSNEVTDPAQSTGRIRGDVARTARQGMPKDQGQQFGPVNFGNKPKPSGPSPDDKGDGQDQGPSAAHAQPKGDIWSQMGAHNPVPNYLGALFDQISGGKPRPTPSLYEDAQYWGRAINAAVDPGAIAKSEHSIYQDNSAKGRFQQGVASILTAPLGGVVADVLPADKAQWWRENGISNVLSALPMVADPATGLMSMAAQMPSDPRQALGQEAGVFGGAAQALGQAAHHPQDLASLKFYETVGNAALHSLMITGTIIPPIGKVMRVAGVAKLVEHMEGLTSAGAQRNLDKRLAGFRLPDGTVIDPVKEPERAAHYGWINQAVEDANANNEAEAKALVPGGKAIKGGYIPGKAAVAPGGTPADQALLGPILGEVRSHRATRLGLEAAQRRAN